MGLLFLGLLGLIFLIWVLYPFSPEKTFSESSTSKESSFSDDVQESTEPDISDFEEIQYDVEFALTGRMGYSEKQVEMGKKDQSGYNLTPIIDENTKEPLKIATGHTLYRSQTNGNLFIICGETPLAYVNGRLMPTKYLREEHSSLRIRTFNSQQELDTFLQKWQAGQRVLSGETVAKPYSIIIDGCLTDLQFEKTENGDICFNILDVMKEVVPDSYYKKGDGFFYVFLDGLAAERLPTNSIPSFYNDYKANLFTDEYTFSSVTKDGTAFQYQAKIINENDLMVNGKDIHVILGWKFYLKNSVLNIVTAPENVTDKAVVYSFMGNSGYIVKIESNVDGTFSQNTYDAKGNLIKSEPFIDTEGVDPSSDSSSDSTSVLEDSSASSASDISQSGTDESNTTPSSDFEDENIVV